MRINPNIVPDILSAIQGTQLQEQTALQELATGKRVFLPADDPAASALMVQNQVTSSAVDQYTQSAASLMNMMQTVDSTLSSVVTSATQAISLGTEGANGTLTTAQRQTLSQEVQGIFNSALQAGNLSYNGSYVFGGTASTAPPYTAVSTPPGYTYSGNEGVNHVTVGSGYQVQINLPGDQLFSNSNPGSDLLGSLNQLATALQNGTTTDISSATLQLRSALDYFNQQRAVYDNSMTQISAQESVLSQETVNLKSQANTLVGADITQAATMLAQAQTANSAALSAAAKILPVNLLNYLQ